MSSMRDIIKGNRLPEGDYTVTIKSVTEEVSQSNQLKLAFKAVTTDGKEVFWSRSLQPQALWSLGTDLVNAGVTDEDSEFSDLPQERARQFSDLAKELEGQQVDVRVTTGKTRDGKDFTQVAVLGAIAAAATSGDVLSRL